MRFGGKPFEATAEVFVPGTSATNGSVTASTSQELGDLVHELRCFATSRLHCKRNTGDCDNHPECSRLHRETLKEMSSEFLDLLSEEYPGLSNQDRNETARKLFNRMDIVQSRLDKKESVARLKAAGTKVEQKMQQYVNAVQYRNEAVENAMTKAGADEMLDKADTSLKTALAQFEEAKEAMA